MTYLVVGVLETHANCGRTTRSNKQDVIDHISKVTPKTVLCILENAQEGREFVCQQRKPISPFKYNNQCSEVEEKWSIVASSGSSF